MREQGTRRGLSTDFGLTRCCERHPLPQSMGVTELSDDATHEPLLTHADVVELQRRDRSRPAGAGCSSGRRRFR